MSAYKDQDEYCDPTEVVMIYDALTGTCVYAFCPNHQDEYVHPVYAFNLDYFRMVREHVLKSAQEAGKAPHVAFPHRFIENKVITSQKSLAEYLFRAEVSND